MPRPRRLVEHPLTRLERGRAITIRHEGKRVPAFEGEPIAAALYAHGIRVLGRSMRYHRPRGLFCGTGGCTHCFLRIDGVPNVRSCTAPCAPATWAEGQNAFPNVRFDIFAGADVAFPRYFDAHSGFVRPAFLRPVFNRVIRGLAGFGRVPRAPVEQRFLRRRLEPDVLVIGAGPAGLAAAEAAANEGAHTVIVDAEAEAGGRLREQPTPFLHSTGPDAPKTEGKTWTAEAVKRLQAGQSRLLLGTRVFGAYEGTWAAVSGSTLWELRPRAVVIATGSIDAFDPVPGSDRAGVLQATAAARLLNRWGIMPLEPIILHGATRDGLLLARDIAVCGGRLDAVTHDGPVPSNDRLVQDVKRLGIPVLGEHALAAIVGRAGPVGAIYRTPQGRVRMGCQSVILAQGRWVLPQLFQQAGCELRRDDAGHQWRPRLDEGLMTTVDGVYAAGSAAGAADAWQSVLQGRRAGAAAAQAIRRVVKVRS